MEIEPLIQYRVTVSFKISHHAPSNSVQEDKLQVYL